MQTGEFSGLNDKLQSPIANSPYLMGKKLRFEQESGRVRLTGEVASYFQAQMAQEAVKQVDGVTLVDNQLQVIAY